MLQSQLINLLCDRADDVYGGRLPVHVRLILDEFANIGQIPNFDKLIATIRSREISASIILQSQSQLKAIYKDAAEIISDNCDSVLFLSGRGKNAKEISDALGKETIDSFNTSENRGSQTSHGLNYQKLGKELMSQDEIAVMDGGKCTPLHRLKRKQKLGWPCRERASISLVLLWISMRTEFIQQATRFIDGWMKTAIVLVLFVATHQTRQR